MSNIDKLDLKYLVLKLEDPISINQLIRDLQDLARNERAHPIYYTVEDIATKIVNNINDMKKMKGTEHLFRCEECGDIYMSINIYTAELHCQRCGKVQGVKILGYVAND